MELTDEIYGQITRISEQGNEYMDERQYFKALQLFEKGLDLLPEPKRNWEAYTWLKASIADTYFHLKQFESCKEAAFDALNGVDALDNPFIYLRLGQSLFELGELDRAESELLKAYMLAGKEIFSEDDSKYEAFLSQRHHID
jgi:tetratricopeptide (TPR) repeat protein